MIKPLYFNPIEVNRAYLRRVISESREQEDADLNVVEEVQELAPVCKIEEELREYIRNAIISRRITHLFVHTTATRQNATVTAIKNYWKNTMGWRNPGYHIILPTEGFTVIADFNTVCNGVKGFNTHGVHISYIGGIDSNGRATDNRTESQARLIEVFIEEMVKRFPGIKVLGHNEVSSKSCPSFKVKDEYSKYWTGK